MLPVIESKYSLYVVPLSSLKTKLSGKHKTKEGIPKDTFPANIGGVYVFFSFVYGFLYVGRSKNLRSRLRMHLHLSSAWNYLNDMNNALCLKLKKANIEINYSDILIIILPIKNMREQKIIEIELISQLRPILNQRKEVIQKTLSEI